MDKLSIHQSRLAKHHGLSPGWDSEEQTQRFKAGSKIDKAVQDHVYNRIHMGFKKCAKNCALSFVDAYVYMNIYRKGMKEHSGSGRPRLRSPFPILPHVSRPGFRWEGAGRVAQRDLTFTCNFWDVYRENVFLNIQVIEMIILNGWGLGNML